MKRHHLRLGLIVLMPLMTVACGRLARTVDEGIESAGSDVTGVPVEVRRVRLSIARGAGQISGLTVANPPGYEADYALQMNLLHLNLGIISTLTGEPIVLDELVIDSPVIHFEANARDGSNLKDLIDRVIANVDANNAAKVEVNKPSGKPPPDRPPKKPIRIRVRKLLIKGVGFSATFADGTTASGVLPTIHLVGVGGKAGATPAELGSVVVVAMAREMFKELVAEQLNKHGGRIILALDALDVDDLMTTLEETLVLSSDQVDQVRPIIEQQIEGLKGAVAHAQEQGFVEFGSLPKRFEAAAADVLEQLVDVLDEEQLDALSALFDERNVAVIEELWNGLVAELTRFLELTPEQIERLQPLLREQLTKRYALLQRLVDAPDDSPIDEFMRDYEALQAETRQLLDDVLSPSRMEAFGKRQAEFLEILRTVYFGVM